MRAARSAATTIQRIITVTLTAICHTGRPNGSRSIAVTGAVTGTSVSHVANVPEGDLMINDGLCSFGFGCHESNDEIMFGKYNVTTIFSRNIGQYINNLSNLVAVQSQSRVNIE